MRHVGLNYNNENSEVLKEFLKIKAEKENSNILDLYGVKACEDETGEEFIDKAHPGKTNFVPSYIENGGDDEINTIKNQNEQQQRDFEAAMRMPNGSVHRKLAMAQMLSEELYLVAEEMDARGEVDIAKYADMLMANLQKYALHPLLIGGIAISALVPLIGAWWKMSNEATNLGFNKNLMNLISSTDEFAKQLQESGQKDEVISDILDNLKNVARTLYHTREKYIAYTKEDIDALKSFYQKIKPKWDLFKEYKNSKTTATEETKQQLKLSQQEIVEVENIKKRLNVAATRYEKYCQIMKTQLEKILLVLEQQITATDAISPGGFSSVIDSINKFMGGSKGQSLINNIKQIIAQIDSEFKLNQSKQKYILDNLSEIISTEKLSDETGLDFGGEVSDFAK